MVISHSLTTLGDLASALKHSGQASKKQAGPSIAKTLSPGFSNTLAKKAKLTTLVNISKYNRDLAAGNINPNFVKSPSTMTEDQARARFLGIKPVATLTTAAPSTGPALLSPAALSNIFTKSITKALPGATPVAAAPTPVQQAAAAVVAAQPDLATQQSALTTTGGGGGGGGGGDMSPADTTDATTPDDTATGWAALSTGAKVGVVVGAVAVAGGIYWLVKRRR